MSVSKFGTGVRRAREVRRELLESFGAEDEWVWGGDSDQTIKWAPGPLGTRFMVEPVRDSVPGLGIVHVFTICATVLELDIARTAVSAMNFHTTFERWSVLNDPELDLVRSVPADNPFGLPLSPWHDEDACIAVASGVSFVVGDPRIDLPFTAMRAIVAGAIAKANAVVTNGFADSWGRPDVVHDEDGNMRPGDDWNRVLYFFDDEITPRRDEPCHGLAEALANAFELERSLQFETCPAAWYGSGDRNGFTCEVPYGPGPYPLGVIGGGMFPHLASPENSTSLVRGLVQANPFVGNGLVLAVTTGGPGPTDEVPTQLLPALLNAQNRLREDEASPGFAHAVGAWVHQFGITHVSFIPSAWEYLLTSEELINFFRVMLANAARLSWGSRMVMEPYRDRQLTDVTAPNPPGGLAAGALARGPEFGEIGAGQDPGAVGLGFVWNNLVGRDEEYAIEFNDIPGFRFWMGPAVVDVTSHSCGCSRAPCSVLVIESDLGADTPLLRAHLREILQDPQPFGIAADDTRLIAAAQVHVHDGTVGFGARWAVPLAVALALLADRLPPAADRDVDLRTSDGTPRLDRDGMLGNPGEPGLWDPRGEWIAEGRAQSREIGLLHALLLTANPGFRAGAIEEGLSVSRTFPYRAGEDDDWTALALESHHAYIDHTQYGRSLLITTDIPADAEVDAYVATDSFRREGFTLLGGFGPIPGGVRLSTLYPLAFDRSWTYTDQVSFAGTALQHHLVVVHRSLWWVDGATGRIADAAVIAEGVTEFIATYRAMENVPEALDIAAVSLHDAVAVQWARPWPYEGLDASPRLCSDAVVNDGRWLQGQIVVDPVSTDPWPLRVIHAVLALSAPPDPSRLEEGALLSDLAFLPGPDAVASLYRQAEDLFEVTEDADGDFLIQDEAGEPIAQLIFRLRDDHQAWGTSLDVVARMLVPAAVEDEPRTIHPTVIGAWSQFDDALEYHISLPPVLFACLDTRQPKHEAVMTVATVIAQARAAAKAGRIE